MQGNTNIYLTFLLKMQNKTQGEEEYFEFEEKAPTHTKVGQVVISIFVTFFCASAIITILYLFYNLCCKKQSKEDSE